MHDVFIVKRTKYDSPYFTIIFLETTLYAVAAAVVMKIAG